MTFSKFRLPPPPCRATGVVNNSCRRSTFLDKEAKENSMKPSATEPHRHGAAHWHAPPSAYARSPLRQRLHRPDHLVIANGVKGTHDLDFIDMTVGSDDESGDDFPRHALLPCGLGIPHLFVEVFEQSQRAARELGQHIDRHTVQVKHRAAASSINVKMMVLIPFDFYWLMTSGKFRLPPPPCRATGVVNNSRRRGTFLDTTAKEKAPCAGREEHGAVALSTSKNLSATHDVHQ